MHNEDALTAGRPALVPHNDSSSSSYMMEKQNDSGTTSVEILDEKMDAYMQVLDEGAEPEYRNGVKVIQTGRDVSRFVVDVRDDGDEALTFRSIFLGTVFAGMGAALCQASNSIHLLLPEINLILPLVISVHGFLLPSRARRHRE